MPLDNYSETEESVYSTEMQHAKDNEWNADAFAMQIEIAHLDNKPKMTSLGSVDTLDTTAAMSPNGCHPSYGSKNFSMRGVTLKPSEKFNRAIDQTKEGILAKGAKLRGVPFEELEARFKRAQDLMREHEVDCMLLTTEADVYYFTGVATRFWNSPTRPFFLLIAVNHTRPICVIPSVFPQFGSKTWIGPENIYEWAAPNPDDDGVSLVSQKLLDVCVNFKRAGFQMGLEKVIRAPLSTIDTVRDNLKAEGVTTVDASDIMMKLRVVKSPLEVSRQRHACHIASAAFAALPAKLHALAEERHWRKFTEREVRKAFHGLLIDFGADECPYVMCQSGPQGYDNLVLESTDKILANGDVVIIDTGCRFESYWSDFDRNFVVGGQRFLEEATVECHQKLWDSTEDGFNACHHVNGKPSTSRKLFEQINTTLGINPEEFSTGRMGHGLGLQLTELYSNNAHDCQDLLPGVVFTIEPGMNVPGSETAFLAHEECCVINQDGECEWLSHRASRQMVAIFDHEDLDGVIAESVWTQFEREFAKPFIIEGTTTEGVC